MTQISNTEDWLAAFPHEATEREVRNLEARLAKAQERLAQAQLEVAGLQARLAPRKQALALWAASRSTSEGRTVGELGRPVRLWRIYAGSDHDSELGDWIAGSRPTLRAAIRSILEDAGGYPLKLSEIRDRLLANGWVSDDENGAHRIQMMASDMARKGQLVRPKTGFYVLPLRARPSGRDDSGT